MKLDLGIIAEEQSWKSIKSINKKSISHILKEVLDYFPAFQKSTIEVAVLLTNDSQMQKLNWEFLKKDKPTNVLSFPDHEVNKQSLFEPCGYKEHIYIGDIALGFETVKTEAETTNINIYDHFVHLLIHGLLHLLGYDHIIEDEEREMMELEIKFLHDLGIKSPY
jgi:probable rRNA maturation factor